MKINKLFLSMILLSGTLSMASAADGIGEEMTASISLKVPGNDARSYPLAFQKSGNGVYNSPASATIPVEITRQVKDVNGAKRITVNLKAVENVYFNYGEKVKTGYSHSESQFYMPGFWYRRNLRSPKEAPSFHTSDSWLVREDRLSTPLTAAFNPVNGKSMSVIRIDKFDKDALATHKEGEVILSGETSIVYT